MRRLWSMWGVGLCLGLTGCAATERRMVLDPGAGLPGASPLPDAQALPPPQVHCGCGPLLPPVPVPQPAPAPPTVTLARFFPFSDEQDGVQVDPLEKVRPDPLGVRTVRLPPAGLSDGKMVRTSAGEPTPNEPMSGNLAAQADVEMPPPVPSVDADVEVEVEVDEDVLNDVVNDVVERTPAAPGSAPRVMPVAADGPSGTAAEPPRPALSRPVPALSLEYVEDPSLAGRPRLASDGTLLPRPRAGGDPTGYGPEPTFPASYSAHGSAPTSVPKTCEVWPTRRPWRPTLLSRVLQKFRKAEGAKPVGPGSALGEPRDLAKRGQGVDRIATNRPDESSQR